MSELEIKDLHVSVEGKTIIKGLNLKIKEGEIHVIMGPNGSGKTSLAYSILGHPKYNIEKGEIIFDGKNILNMKPDERARLGLFLGFQYPMEIQGVSVFNFLRQVFNSTKNNGHIDSLDKKKDLISVMEFRNLLNEKLNSLKMDPSFSKRYLNDGFSGGEKKRTEILQMAVLEPKIAILDETDSGLDVSSIKIVFEGISEIQKSSKMGVLLITHYGRILEYIKPDFVHIMKDGIIVKSGDINLAKEIDMSGYEILGEN